LSEPLTSFLISIFRNNRLQLASAAFGGGCNTLPGKYVYASCSGALHCLIFFSLIEPGHDWIHSVAKVAFNDDAEAD